MIPAIAYEAKQNIGNSTCVLNVPAEGRPGCYNTSAKPRFRWRKNNPPSTNTLIE